MRLIAFLSLMLVGGAALSAPPRAVLKDHVTIEGERIYLADVADFENVESSLAERFGAIDLGTAPRAGLSERVSAKRIAAFVNRRESEAHSLKWQGAREVRIRRESQTVALEEIEEAILRSLSSTKIQSIDLADSTRSPLIPNGRYELQVNRLALATDCRSGRATVSAVGADRVLSTSIFKFSSTPAQVEGSAPLCEESLAMEGGKAVSLLGAGRHDNIAIEIHEKGLVLETTAVALRDARLGETFNVRNPASDAVYRVKLIAPGRATFVSE